MDILSFKYSGAFLIISFSLMSAGDTSEANGENPTLPLPQQGYSAADKRKMLQNLKGFGETKENNMDLKKQLPTDKVPLSASLPADTFDTFGAANSQGHHDTTENTQVNNTFPADLPLPLGETLEEDPFFPYQDITGQLNDHQDPNILAMPENNNPPQNFQKVHSFEEEQFDSMRTQETSVR
ncbi:hypothetical protein [Candidatus Odyssella acanthamoebae]|uniref:Uncharacterized protein n=1 Tax=Candidatus Odyssella acanthamoebae TaxID=91604 RepID=A0A077AT02_9PROT|nr:hypothetical protein [Candidatus Paracaedibacter acanthamoebae]AIK96332.1 hypothetical protein ID47_05675 [Candidatus Paracaedibacter acanthamoebae]